MNEPSPAGVTVVDHPLVQHKLTLMRSVDTAPAVFRRLLTEATMLLSYEGLRTIPTRAVTVTTPLGDTEGAEMATEPVVISILRAGNGMLDGLLQLVPTARVGFVGMYRDHDTLKAVTYYCKLPDNLDKHPVVVVDPMLATANTAVAALELIKAEGATEIRFVSLVSAPEGIAALRAAHPDVQIVTASIDERLNENGYIVPGLGDAGDRIFGTA